MARPYRDLVWLAYLALPIDGHAIGAAERRLLLAHRLAAAELSRTNDDDAVRQALLRRVLRTRIRPWSGRFPSLEIIPAIVRGGDTAFTTSLEGLPAPARAAYALLRLSELEPERVTKLLIGAGVADAAGALAAVRTLEEEFGSAAAALHRPASDPTLARIYGRIEPGRRRKVVAGLAFCALALVAVLPWLKIGQSDAARAPVQAAEAEALRVKSGTWRTTTKLDLEAWEPRGALVGDDALVRRAIHTWRGSGVVGGVQLLYAGQVDDARVVLLRDPGRVARYLERGGRNSMEVFPEPRAKPDGASPLKLTTTAKGNRYLLPPWVREVSTAALSASAPSWRKVAAKDGVTATVRGSESRGCWRGPVLRLRAPEIAHGQPYTMIDFGRLTLANITYQPPPPAEINRYGPNELDTLPAGFSGWRYVGCALERPAGEIQAATAWEFWAGGLPEGATGRWMCARFTDARGGSVVRGVLLSTHKGRTKATVTGERRDTWECSRLARDVVSGTWWRAPSGTWHYVAAGSRRVVRVVIGERGTDGAFTSTTGGSRDRQVRLSAVNELGERVPALQ